MTKRGGGKDTAFGKVNVSYLKVSTSDRFAPIPACAVQFTVPRESSRVGLAQMYVSSLVEPKVMIGLKAKSSVAGVLYVFSVRVKFALVVTLRA